MKKALTIILSLVTLFSVSIGTISVMARDYIISPETTQQTITIKVTLNGEDSNHTSYNPDSNNPNVITFTYTGGHTLVGWDFKNGVEGIDYEIISQEGNTLVIRILEGHRVDKIWANAVDTSSVYGEDENGEQNGNGELEEDKGTKSPKTGAASGIGIMATGLAILIATRKRR